MVQQSGPKNSLGLVKFDMQDKEAIYLHDTPAKALFAHARAASQPRLRPGRKCAPVRDGARRSRRALLDEFSKAMQPGRAKVRQAADANSGAAALPDRLLGRVAGSVPPRRLWLGQQCRQGARPCAGAAASTDQQPESSDDIGP